MVERDTSWALIAFAGVATVVVLTGMYFVGIGLNEYKIDELRNDINNLEAEQRSHALGYELAEGVAREDSCEATRRWVDQSQSEISRLQEEVADYEDSSKRDDPRYTVLKKRHTNLVIQNFLEIRQLEEDCGDERHSIIYIYSNEQCAICEEQGTVLTFYNQEYEDVVIHPLDTDLNMRHVNFLEDYYEIDTYPALIFEGEVYQGFQSKEDVREIIGEERLEQ